MLQNKGEINWEAVEKEYRVGIRALRSIGGEYGCTEAAIRKRAKRDGWTRDLSARIKDKADELVRKELVRKEVRKNDFANEKQVVEANAEAIKDVIIGQRTDIKKARQLVTKYFDELSTSEGEISFGVRVDVVKKLSDALKNLVTMERQAFRMDEMPIGTVTLEETIESICRVNPELGIAVRRYIVARVSSGSN